MICHAGITLLTDETGPPRTGEHRPRAPRRGAGGLPAGARVGWGRLRRATSRRRLRHGLRRTFGHGRRRTPDVSLRSLRRPEAYPGGLPLAGASAAACSRGQGTPLPARPQGNVRTRCRGVRGDATHGSGAPPTRGTSAA